MSKIKHINVIKAHIEVAIPFGPEDNLLLLTTQIKEAARKLTGFVDCKTTLGKVPAPSSPTTVTTVTMPMVEQTTDNTHATDDDMPKMSEQLRRA